MGCFSNMLKLFDSIPARLILYLLSLSCIVVSFLIRTVINIAILAMVKERNASSDESITTESICKLNNNFSVKALNYGGTLEWSLDVQYYVLTTFYWTYIASQVIGAIVAQKYGSKVALGISLLTSSACNLSIPLASELHYSIVIFLQLLNGFAQGLIWPALYAMISCWIPLQEKSRYITCFQGLSIGAALSQLQSGYIIAYFGWKYAFYISGILGATWCMFWYFLAFDTPELHPRISVNELIYIQTNREQILNTTKRKVPWLSILSSVPMWATSIAAFGRIWVFSVALIYGPMYLKTVVGLEVKMNGLLSGLISFSCFFTSVILSYISDKIEIHKLISTIANRKLFTGIGSIVASLLCIGINYLNCNLTLILIFWAFIQIVMTFNFIGTMVNIVDIAPNFSGPATSVIQMILLAPNVLSTFVAKIFLSDGSTMESWKNIFNTAAGITCFSSLIFLCFASSKVQKWDMEKNCDYMLKKDILEELQELEKYDREKSNSKHRLNIIDRQK